MNRGHSLALALSLAAASISLGCSDEDELTLRPLCIVFTPSAPSTTPLAARTGPGTTCNKLVLEIVAHQDPDNMFPGVFSMALDFSYPTHVGALDINSIEPAAVWTDSGTTTPFTIIEQYDEEPLGTVTTAISRIAPAPGFDVAMGDVLATLSIFQTTSGGSGSLTFVSGRLQDSALPPNTIALVPTNTVVGTISIVQQ